MSNSKKTMNAFTPFLPVWGWNKSMKDQEELWDDFQSTLETFWDQMQKMEKLHKRAFKDHWKKAFPLLMDMQDNFAAFLPDEISGLPGMPSFSVTPKDFRDKLREFQEMANEHATEQADTLFDYRVQKQQQTRTIVTDAIEKVKENVTKEASEKTSKKETEKTTAKTGGTAPRRNRRRTKASETAQSTEETVVETVEGTVE